MGAQLVVPVYALNGISVHYARLFDSMAAWVITAIVVRSGRGLLLPSPNVGTTFPYVSPIIFLGPISSEKGRKICVGKSTRLHEYELLAHTRW